MARKNKNAHRQRVFDTRLSFRQMANKLGLTPLQRVKIAKFMKKGGEHQNIT
ncbi:MAG: hypothetical protein AAB922_05515 [Patescibacteria group bacterium]